MTKKIYIFTIPICRRCIEVMDLMRENSIQFTELPMFDNRPLWEQIKAQSPGEHLIFPTIFVQEGEDGSGFAYAPKRDFITNDDILKILKNNI